MQIAMLQVPLAQRRDRFSSTFLGRPWPKCWALVPHLCHTCAGQEIYTEVNDKLEMSQIAQQKMQARPSRQAANPDSETLGGSICFNGYRENIWSEDLNRDLVLLMIHTHLSKNCFSTCWLVLKGAHVLL